MTGKVRGIGEILHWPGGYAMTLGVDDFGNNAVRCCPGHKSPEDAKNHGLVRLIEIASGVSDQCLSAWAAEEAS